MKKLCEVPLDKIYIGLPVKLIEDSYFFDGAFDETFGSVTSLNDLDGDFIAITFDDGTKLSVRKNPCTNCIYDTEYGDFIIDSQRM